MEIKKFSAVLLSATLLLSPLSFSSQAEASILDKPVPTEVGILDKLVPIEDNTLNELVPYVPLEEGEVGIYGANPPGFFASTHDISVNAYNYQVIKVGSELFTDKFIKGKTSMTVNLKDWDYSDYPAPVASSVTVTLYTSSGKVSGKTLSVSGGTGSVNFTGLNASTKYYVGFTVPRNGVTYSFNGSIK